MNNLIENIKELLKGIDQTENESNDGWWETSTGAEFGRDKLNMLIELVEKKCNKVEKSVVTDLPAGA